MYVILGDDARGDQHAVGADPERNGALLRSRQRAGRQAAAQAIEFGTMRPRPAVRARADAAWLRHRGPGDRPASPVIRPVEINATQAAAPSRQLVYKASRHRPFATSKF